MAIAYLGKSAPYIDSTQQNSRAFNMVMPNAEPHPAVLVHIAHRTSDNPIARVTIGEIELTRIGFWSRASRSTSELWAISGASCPNDGTSMEVRMYFEASITSSLGAIGTLWSGVADTPSLGFAGGDLFGTEVTTSISGVLPGEWLIDVMAGYNDAAVSFTPGPGQTEIDDFIWYRGALPFVLATSYKSATVANDSMTQAPNNGEDMAHLIVRLAPAPEEPTEPPPATSGSSARALILRRALIAR